MSIWDLRQWIEQRTPWWVILVAPAFAVGSAAFYWAMIVYDENHGRGAVRFIRRFFGSSQLGFEEAMEREEERRGSNSGPPSR